MEKLLAIEEYLKVIKDINLYDSTRASKICLVLDIIILQKSKLFEITRYTSVE